MVFLANLAAVAGRTSEKDSFAVMAVWSSDTSFAVCMLALKVSFIDVFPRVEASPLATIVWAGSLDSTASAKASSVLFSSSLGVMVLGAGDTAKVAIGRFIGLRSVPDLPSRPLPRPLPPGAKAMLEKALSPVYYFFSTGFFSSSLGSLGLSYFLGGAFTSSSSDSGSPSITYLPLTGSH